MLGQSQESQEPASALPSFSQGFSTTCAHPSSSVKCLSHLAEIFPSHSEESLRYFLKSSGYNISYASECMLTGPSLDSLVSMVFNSNEDEMRL